LSMRSIQFWLMMPEHHWLFQDQYHKDRHEFNELKPKIENLVSIQRQLANGFYPMQKN
jgi:hypothetical protein